MPSSGWLVEGRVRVSRGGSGRRNRPDSERDQMPPGSHSGRAGTHRSRPGILPESGRTPRNRKALPACLRGLGADGELGSACTPPECVLMPTNAPSIPESDPERPGMGGSLGQGPLSPPSLSSGDLTTPQETLNPPIPKYGWSTSGVRLECGCSTAEVPICPHVPERSRESTGLLRMLIPRQVVPR